MKFRVYRQADSMDCGPACLKMIASYYGKEYPITILREYSFLTREGVSLLSISKAAEKIGFKTIGGKFTLEQLVDKIPLPCILHWEQNHFVVLYNISKKKDNVYFNVADPGKGLMKYNKDEFINLWISTKFKNEDRGIALLLEPTLNFNNQDGEEQPAIEKGKISFLYGYIKKYNTFFKQLILGLLIGSLVQLIFPFLTQAVVDIGINNKDIGFIWLILLGQLMLLIGRTSIDFIRRRILLHISTRINISLISDFFIKLMKLPMKFFDGKLLGDLLQRIEDHERVERFLTAQTLNLLFSIFTFFVFGVVLLIYSLKIFFIFLGGSLLYCIWILFFLNRRRQLDYRYFKEQSINQSKIYQLLTGMQEIKLQGCEQRKRWDWEDTQADLFHTNLKILSLQQTQEAGSICINEVKNILITILSAMAVINGELTLGMMLSVQYIIGQLNSPIEQLVTFVYQWQDVGISLDRMGEIHLREEEENKERKIQSISQNNGGDILLDNLSFFYEGPHSKRVLNNINLKIPSGKVTAIVGASGSGKTTLIKLLLGNYSPSEGIITVGGEPLEKFNLSWWRSQCGAVMQDGFIFSESIAKNIAIADEEIDKKKLKHAAEVANIESFISELPLSYNTLVGQEGQGISQGQKQRLLIARAVYKDPHIIFFDEATNALDANNERIILDNLEKFYQGKTVVVVAHRLSTVKNAHQIIVLDQGEIVERGDHETLTKLRGKYYHLVKNQLELGN